VQTKDENISVAAAKPSVVVDPTGAGDAYRAGFLAGFSKNLDLKICAQMGSVSSCYAIEKYGTTNHTFTVEGFKKRYKENFGEDLSI
ncbi:MAG: PfkB family carbohydrate kinase, partial [Candidatus Daviesbacteria bacterium]|nr:PfkB family carbohydrate kinase [Candidatus Daviesbacteria bacterium]